jgi:hypothetical protein
MLKIGKLQFGTIDAVRAQLGSQRVMPDVFLAE